jgi:hypothetical protein
MKKKLKQQKQLEKPLQETALDWLDKVVVLHKSGELYSLPDEELKKKLN